MITNILILSLFSYVVAILRAQHAWQLASAAASITTKIKMFTRFFIVYNKILNVIIY